MVAQRGQEWTHTIVWWSLCLALDHGRWADLPRTRCSRRATGRSRTFDFGATGPGARGALSLGLIALTAIQNDRLGLGNRGLENIVAQIRHRRHLRFKDIIGQIGHLRTRGHSALENIATHIRFSARRACGFSGDACLILEAFKHRTTKHNSYHNAH